MARTTMPRPNATKAPAAPEAASTTRDDLTLAVASTGFVPRDFFPILNRGVQAAVVGKARPTAAAVVGTAPTRGPSKNGKPGDAG